MIIAQPRNSTSYDIGKTKSFRLSSKMILGEWGSNLQNVEKSMRTLYKADPGYVMIQVDQSGAEALVVAYLTKYGRLRKLFEAGVKSHVYVALHVFSDVWEKTYPTLTHAAKAAPVEDLRRLPGWKQLEGMIKESDKWPAERRYYFMAKKICHACVTSEHEVLTQNGWIRVSDISTLESIAVWSPKNERITFEIPSAWNTYDYNDRILKVNDPQCSFEVTPIHRIGYYSNNMFHVKTAEELISYKGARIPTAGYYSGGNTELKSDEVRLLVAIQADGSIINNHTVRFRFQKSRKIKRLKSILVALGIDFQLSVTDAFEFYIKGLEKLLVFFKDGKTYGPWLLNLSESNLDVLIDELKYWDGTYEKLDIFGYTHKREAYFSSIKQNVEWIKTILHLRGKQGTLTTGNRTYTLGINNRKRSRLVNRSIVQYNGKVHCPTTSTGFFLIRHNGKISITGNSNYGMGAKTFQLALLEESDGTIAISRQQAEKFLATYHLLFPEIRQWHIGIQQQVKTTKTLRNLFGYPFQFTGFIGDSMWKEAYAFIPQSTVGTITNIAYTNLQVYIEENEKDWHLLANTHDSYLVEVPDNQDERTSAITKMQEFINMDLTSPTGVSFKMKSEAQVGYNWGPYDKDKNPNGLKEAA